MGKIQVGDELLTLVCHSESSWPRPEQATCEKVDSLDSASNRELDSACARDSVVSRACSARSAPITAVTPPRPEGEL